MKNKYLVVIDMQKDFIDGSLGSPDAQAIVENVCEKIRNYDGYIYFTKDTHDKDMYSKTLEGKLLPVPHCLLGEAGHEFDERIKAAVEEYMDKNDMIAPATYKKPTFGSIALATAIGFKNRNNEEIEEIEVCGLCTDICVVSNALLLRAWFPDVPMKVDSKCCAGTSKENHEAALKVMKSCQIEVV